MIDIVKTSLWLQFGASIDMLRNAIALCPEEYWDTHRKLFYNAYHVLVFLDYYLTLPPKGFSSPLPFTIKDPADAPPEALDDVIPDRIYNRTELLDYLRFCREKCHTLIAGLTEENLHQRWIEEDREFPLLELLLYNMRHVQHHAAQLSLLLRQGINNAPGWVGRTNEPL